MEAKLIEIRDKHTFIPALAVSISAEDGYLAMRAGFGHRAIQLVHISSWKSHNDPYDWGDRTMSTAHLWIQDHWDELSDGDLVDVEYILGETITKKISEEC